MRPLLGSAFLSCRLAAPNVGEVLDAAGAILARIRDTGNVRLDDTEPCVAAMVKLALWKATDMDSVAPALSPSSTALFDVLERGVDDLRRLRAAGSLLAVRNLGCALHPLPPLLTTPTTFDRRSYLFCMRFVAFHWGELSDAFKSALCDLLGCTRENLEALVHEAEFAASMYDEP